MMQVLAFSTSATDSLAASSGRHRITQSARFTISRLAASSFMSLEKAGRQSPSEPTCEKPIVIAEAEPTEGDHFVAYQTSSTDPGLVDALRQVADLPVPELLERRYERLKAYGRFTDTTER